MTTIEVSTTIQKVIDKAYEYRAKAEAFAAYSPSWEALTELAEREFSEASGMVSGYIWFAPSYDPKVLDWWDKRVKEWYSTK